MSGPRVRTLSDSAFLAEYADLDETLDAAARLRASRPDGVVDVVPAARTVLVAFRPELVHPSAVRSWLLEPGGAVAADDVGELVEVPVRYDGPDLGEVAGHLGCSVDEVVRRHTGADWRVAFTGFAPGFGYLAGDDPGLDVARRATPRTRVPEGSVGLAGAFSGVYPKAAPGGWQLIGTTDLTMFDLEREPAALFRPGVRVRFTVADRERVTVAPPAVEAGADAPGSDDGTDAPSLVLERAGVQVLVQDLGRSGLADQGVGPAGAADRGALRDANRLVGNPPDAAGLELALGGAGLRASSRLVAAVTGADADIAVTRRDGRRRTMEPRVPFALDPGDVVDIGPARRGARSYVAVRGGVDAPATLGSRSRDTLAELGPEPIGPGDRIRIGPEPIDSTAAGPAPGRELPAAGDLVELDVVLGPRDDWFTRAAVERFTTQEWTVTPRADRVGLRLTGERPLERARTDELASEGTVVGSVQVPADGMPVVFLADHPLTGGYPVIAAVADHHLDLAGQLPPGVRIRFRAVRPEHDPAPGHHSNGDHRA